MSCPFLGFFPSVLSHQVIQHFSNWGRTVRLFFGISKCTKLVFPYSNNYNPWPQLRNSKIGCIKQFNVSYIAKFLDFGEDMLPVFIKSRVQEPTHIFQHDCSWFNFLNKPDRFREQVAFIILFKLLASNRKGRTRNAASK